MFRSLATLMLPLLVGACATKNTSTHWTCMPGGDHCSSIAETDAKDTDKPRNAGGVIFDAKPARWWEPNAPGTATRDSDPRRESDQVMRVVIAPFVDAQGDYHGRSEIFAVVRKAQWWLSPPVAQPSSSASDKAGDTSTGKTGDTP